MYRTALHRSLFAWSRCAVVRAGRGGAVSILLTLVVLAGCDRASATNQALTLPAPQLDAAPVRPGELQTAVLAGGCFWGIQAVFQHVKGVQSAISGYAGGGARDAHYDDVSSGSTGHAEAVKITFDPQVVSYGQLLRVFFSVAHDPTQLNRQGPDRGTQYRSAIFAANAEQQRIAAGYIAQLSALKVFDATIVTQINGASPFYRAESYHQDYATNHPDNPYIAINDAPKVVQLQQHFAALYTDRPTLTTTRVGSR